MAVWLPVQFPHCHNIEVIKNGRSAEGEQRYRCQNPDCPYRAFILNQTYPGRTKQVKRQIVEVTTPVACNGKPDKERWLLNGSGV